MNEIFRRSGEPTYYTPMAVVGQLVNQEGGTVVIGNPPFSDRKFKVNPILMIALCGLAGYILY